MQKQPGSLFGIRLRAARERLGLAQDRVGVAIGLDEGCSSARISRYETGVHQPSFEVAQKLATVLTVPAEYFYCADDQIAEILLDLNTLSENELASIRRSIRRVLKTRHKT
jgi:transcriptional regulator with XRE-family HTH domain